MDNEQGEKVFTSLFERFRKPYILFAYSYVKDMDEAEDIYMDIMLRFWENRKELPENIHIPSYLLTAVRNRAQANQGVCQHVGHLQRFEHQSRELNFRISSLEACEPSELFTDEIRRIIDDTLRDLSEYTRMIFYMSRYENKTNKRGTRPLLSMVIGS